MNIFLLILKMESCPSWDQGLSRRRHWTTRQVTFWHSEFMRRLPKRSRYVLIYPIFYYLANSSMQEGGSWEVRVSLAAVGKWLRSLGRVSPAKAFGKESILPLRTDHEVAQLSVTWPTASGQTTVTTLRHPAILSETPVREGESGVAPMVLTAHEARWL
jgi:hypothetical protein